MFAETYNSLIAAFGQHFDEFSSKELARFAKALATAGLRQGDIYESIVTRVKELAEGKFNLHSSFSQTYVPIFRSFIEVGLNNQEGTQDAFQKLISDDYIKAVISGTKTLEEHV
jgi:hypothetical protein